MWLLVQILILLLHRMEDYKWVQDKMLDLDQYVDKTNKNFI